MHGFTMLHKLTGFLLLCICCYSRANHEAEYSVASTKLCPDKGWQEKDAGNGNMCKVHKDFDCGEIEPLHCPQGMFVADKSKCVDTKLVGFECRSGTWAHEDILSREKRFFGAVLGIIASVVSIVADVCSLFCSKSSGGGTPAKNEINKSPEFTDCPTGIIEETASMGQTTATVNWTKPTATDPEKKKVSVDRISGKDPGSVFEEGDTLIGYKARDADGATDYCWFTVNVKVRECTPRPRYIQHGSYSCTGATRENIFGSECTYTCEEGYSMAGGSNNTVMRCQANSTWDHPLPSCTAVSCGDPVSVQSGSVICPGGHEYTDVCYVLCKEGFRQQTDANESPISHCTKGGSWTSTQDCVDVTAPEFKTNCPNKILYAGPLASPVPVTWDDPQITDDSNYTLTSTIAKGTVLGPGFHMITLTATDEAGNYRSCSFGVSILVKSCPAPVLSSNSQLINCTKGHVAGSQCTVICSLGFVLDGSSYLTCLDTETWDLPVPTCEATECGNPTTEYGRFVGSSFQYQSVLTLVCDENFDQQGENYIRCQENGTWTKAGECVDNHPPTFPNGCPDNVELDASRLGEPTVASWTPPLAEDNSNKNITLQSSLAPGSQFSPGVTRVTYTATDHNGNSRSCDFTVTVTTLTCPSLTQSYSPTNYLRYQCPNKNVFGAECTPYCLNGFPRAGADNMTCEQDMATFPPTMMWKWDSGSSEPHCIVTNCANLTAPKNGALACVQLDLSKECKMSCHEDWDIPASINGGRFVCANSIGQWDPSSVPDCIVRVRPRYVRLESELFYYSNSCPDSMDELKENFMIRMNNSAYAASCASTLSCRVDNVQVSCGAFRRKKSIPEMAQHEMSRSTGHTQLFRQKRSSTHYVLVRFDIIIDGSEEMSDEDIRTTREGTYVILTNETRNGFFDMVNLNLTTDDYSFSFPLLTGDCEPGLLFRDSEEKISCVGCYRGNFLPPNAKECLQCPIGTYSEVDNATACESCPPGWSTPAAGSSSSSDCQEVCTAGYYSDDGFAPCQPCPPGQFQSAVRAWACNRCPASTWTSGGASSLNQCIPADALLSNNTQLIIRIPDSLPALTLASYLLLKNLSVANVTFASSSHGPISVYLYTHSTLPTYLPPNSATSISVQAEASVWAELVLTSDSSSGLTNISYANADIMSYTASPTSSLSLDQVIVMATDGKVLISGLFGVEGVDYLPTVSASSIGCNRNSSTNLLTWSLPPSLLQYPSTCDAIDECQSSPCSSHGDCINQVGGYLCVCKDGWTGTTCDLPPDSCYQHQCQNGATCLPQGSPYTCVCTEGFSGAHCQLLKVDGGFSEWTTWSDCSAACEGQEQRYRLCNNPVPQNDGDNCTGDFEETRPCGLTLCPVDGQWGNWAEWSLCSATCGGGDRSRQRFCNSPAPQNDGDPCDGVSEEVEVCNTNECPVDGAWSNWAQWSQCTASCGGGTRKRQRLCNSPAPQSGGEACDMQAAEESESCNTEKCPECSELRRTRSILIKCDELADPITCNITCSPGFASSKPFPQYQCGASTNYLWNNQQTHNSPVILPSCSVPTTPTRATLTQKVPLQAGCDVSAEAVRAGVQKNLKQLPCVDCKMSVSTKCEPGNQAGSGRRKRNADTLATTVQMSLNFGNSVSFIESEQTALEQYVESLKLVDQSAVLLVQNETKSFYTVTVNGQVIEPDVNTATYSTSLACAPGSISDSFYCVDCSTGSMEKDGECELCPMGQYQDQPGSTSCKPCPAGLSWDLPGAIDISQCVFPFKSSDTSHDDDDNGDDGTDVALMIGLVVTAVLLTGFLAAVAIYKYKQSHLPPTARSSRGSIFRSSFSSTVYPTKDLSRPLTPSAVSMGGPVFVDVKPAA